MRTQRHLLRLLLSFPLFLLAACGLFGEEDAATLVTPIATVESVAPAAPESTPVTASGTTPDERNITLIVWTTADISPRSEVAGGSVLTEQLNAFAASHPNISLEVQLKTVVGPGGMLNYLRYAQDVAPSILPDIILLPSDQLGAAAQAELIYPLDDLVGDDMVDDLFPAANSLSRVDGTLMGYPFALEHVSHLVYDNTVITETIPASWPDFVQTGARLIFPAGTEVGETVALQYYEALGGLLANEANQPNLQIDLLTQTLAQFNQARGVGLILFQSSNATTPEDAWGVYQNGTANVVLTNSHFFLSQRTQGTNNGIAPIPGPDAPLVPYVGGWVWSLSTADPNRQALALELITWLSEPENLYAWSEQSLLLPPRRTAFAFWPEDDAYIDFLRAELEQALPYPNAAIPVIGLALGDALFNVISLAQTPEDAARQAVNTVRP